MRTLLLSVSALALTMGTAYAQGDWYVSSYGGANWDDVISLPGVDDNTGYVVGGTVGKHIPAVPNMRVELDFSFRHNETDVGPFTVDHDTVGVLANAVYDIPVDLGPVHPYVLAGAGYGSTEAVFESISLAKLEASGFAWQLGAGANTNLTDDGSVKFGLGYRYFRGPEIEILGTELSDGGNHSIIAELTFALN